MCVGFECIAALSISVLSSALVYVAILCFSRMAIVSTCFCCLFEFCRAFCVSFDFAKRRSFVAFSSFYQNFDQFTFTAKALSYSPI